jgi:hypothetical protein
MPSCHLVTAARSLGSVIGVNLAPMAPAAPPVPWWWGPVLTALLTAVLAVVGAWIAIRFDRQKAINQELIKKRIALYDEIVPKANDLLCYFLCVGDWKSLCPSKLLVHKRALDRFANIHGALFSADAIAAYETFIADCFSTFSGRGKPAKLRADMARLKRQFGQDWQAAWEDHFETGNVVDDQRLKASYDRFVEALAEEIGATGKPSSSGKPSRHLPRSAGAAPAQENPQA